MAVRRRRPRGRESVFDLVGYGRAQSPREDSPIGLTTPRPHSTSGDGYAAVDFGTSVRVSMVLVPRGRRPLQDQAQEVLAAQRQILERQGRKMFVTSQTIFLRDPADLSECERLFSAEYGAKPPATSFVFQPPCCGAALALEAWAIGGEDVRVEHFGMQTLSVSSEGSRWIYCAGIRADPESQGVYQQSRDVLEKMRAELLQAGSGFEQVVRTWFYLGGITANEATTQRYKEFNRARTDFYRAIEFHCSLSQPSIPQAIYPASTGIGMSGTSLVAGCMAIETRRDDAFLLPLENPQQTPAYAYHPRFSPQSPKFSRGVALVLGNYITTWVSGTASVVHSLSCHPGDIKRQTEQTIENIERLISSENFGFHGVRHAGARLRDLAKIRVYLKRPEDFAACKAICEKRFGSIPAIYAVAEVCRPELLVEIEGVAFSKRASQSKAPEAFVSGSKKAKSGLRLGNPNV
jgi:enamine deaminase RidA (YjgF/YER057c/UK114 family)